MSSAPLRLQAGFTQDRVWQPLGLIGQPDPFHYVTLFDDFTYWQAGRYTITANANGAITVANADGGAIIFTTNSSTPLVTDIVSLQSDNAHALLDKTKKMAFLCRVQVADITNPALVLGKIQKTTTPFTVTDGIYFRKTSGQTYPVLNVVSGSTVQATLSLNGLFAFVANTYVDLGWQYDGHKYLQIYAGTNLVGSNATNKGLVGQIDISGLTLSSTLLANTLAIQSGTATSKTMQADFFIGCKER